MSELREGERLAGYRIESLLGRGGMSSVYVAFHERLGRRVALKVLAPELGRDERFRDRFVRESQLAAGLDHPNIVPIHEADEADGLLFIAMRLVRGTDLATLIREEGPLDPLRAAGIVRQVAAALDAAHAEGLVHRDVKPANILVVPAAQAGSSEGEHVYLSDFGLTKRSESVSGLTGTGQFVGTIDFMAPEQIEGGEVTSRTDIYSLGCVLHQCLTGQPPFRKDSEVAVLYAHLQEPPPKPSATRPELPGGVDRVVARAMAKRPQDRYTSAGELAAALQSAVRTAAPEVREASPPPRRRAGLAAALAAAALAAAVGLVIVLGGDGGDPSATGSPTGAPTGLTPTPTGPEPTVSQTSSLPPPELHDAAVRIDPDGDVVSTPVENLPLIGLGGLRRIAVGRGGVWIVGVGDSMVHVDPRTGEQQPAGHGRLADSPHDVIVGLGQVWVAMHAGAAQGVVGEVVLGQIDPLTNRIIRPVTMPGLVRLEGPHLGIGDGAVWVGYGSRVARFDPQRNELVRVIQVTGAVNRLAATDEAVWTLDQSTNVVTRIDPATNEVVDTIALQFSPADIDAGPDGAWAVGLFGGTATQIDTSGRISEPLAVGDLPKAVAVSEEAVWVGNSGEGTVTRINPQTRQVVAEIPVGGSPSAITIEEGTGAAWVLLD